MADLTIDDVQRYLMDHAGDIRVCGRSIPELVAMDHELESIRGNEPMISLRHLEAILKWLGHYDIKVVLTDFYLSEVTGKKLTLSLPHPAPEVQSDAPQS